MAMFFRKNATALNGIVLVAIVLMLVSCGNSTGDNTSTTATSEPTSIRVGVGLNTASLPVFVADERGYFGDHGLTAEVSEVQNLLLLPDQLEEQFDIGQSVQPITIFAASQGVPVVVVGGGEVLEERNKSVGGVVVPRNANIKEAGDLMGKKVAVLTPTGSNAFALKFWLQQNGVDPESVELVTVAPPNMLAQLKEGLVDAVYMVSPFTAQALQDDSLELLVNPGYELGVDAPRTGILIASGTWARDNEGTVLSFERAIADAVAFIEANPEDALGILADRTGQPTPEDTSISPPFRATETAEDMQAWIDVMEGVIPEFSFGQSGESLIFQPIEQDAYTPTP